MTAWLVSSAGRRGELVQILRGISRDDRGATVVATDMSPLSAAGALADSFEVVPRATAPDFVARSLEVAKAYQVGIIVPTIDPEIAVYAEHRDLFNSHGIDVWVSSPEVAHLGWDKWSLACWAGQVGVEVPLTREITDLGDLDGPVIAKPRNGSSSQGIVRAEDLAALAAGSLSDDYIVQEVAPGIEVTVDFAVGARGDLLGMVQRRRIEVRAGEVSKGVTVAYPEIEAAMRSVARELPGAYGVLNAQFFYEPSSGSVRLIEINPRFGGGYPLSHYAGANFVQALLKDADGADAGFVTAPAGVLMLRYDTQVISTNFDFGLIDD